MEDKIMYSYNDGETSDENLWEIITYMIDTEVETEHIIGTKLDICRLRRSISDQTISDMEDIIYNREEWSFDENRYLERRLDDIWQAFRNIEMYYPTGEEYTITEQDYKDVIEN